MPASLDVKQPSLWDGLVEHHSPLGGADEIPDGFAVIGFSPQMSSVGGQVTAPGFGAYCATKFALEDSPRPSAKRSSSRAF